MTIWICRWRMNTLVTSQYQPRLSSITKISSRRINQSNWNIQIKLNYLSITSHLHNKYHSKWTLLISIFRTNAIAKGSSFYGGGTGPIQLDDLSCTGTEKNLALCGHRGWGKNNCDHTEDASVICVGKFDLVGVKMLYREEIETVSVQIYKYGYKL